MSYEAYVGLEKSEKVPTTGLTRMKNTRNYFEKSLCKNFCRVWLMLHSIQDRQVTFHTLRTRISTSLVEQRQKGENQAELQKKYFLCQERIVEKTWDFFISGTDKKLDVEEI